MSYAFSNIKVFRMQSYFAALPSQRRRIRPLRPLSKRTVQKRFLVRSSRTSAVKLSRRRAAMLERRSPRAPGILRSNFGPSLNHSAAAYQNFNASSTGVIDTRYINDSRRVNPEHDSLRETIGSKRELIELRILIYFAGETPSRYILNRDRGSPRRR